MKDDFNWEILYALENIPYAYKVSLDNTYNDLNKCNIDFIVYYYGRINGLTFGLFQLRMIDTKILDKLTDEIDKIYEKRFNNDK